MLTKTCEVCGGVCTKSVNTSKTNWAKQRFCSPLCRNRGKDQTKHQLRMATNNPAKFLHNRIASGERLKGKHQHYKRKDYVAVHLWLKRHYGRPTTCEHCKGVFTGKFQMHWANISKEYKRDITDWKRLCQKCHYEYDKHDR